MPTVLVVRCVRSHHLVSVADGIDCDCTSSDGGTGSCER